MKWTTRYQCIIIVTISVLTQRMWSHHSTNYNYYSNKRLPV